MTKLAARMQDIHGFQVMEILARARALEAQGCSIIHMEIGEPDFPTAAGIVQAGIDALAAGRTHYTETAGLPALRGAIAHSYAPTPVDPGRVILTPGASGALQLAFGALVNPGDEVLMADPGYPCYRHLVRLYEGGARLVPVDATTGYQLNAELIDRHWTATTRAVLLATPSNPTGTVVSDAELAAIVATVERRGAALIVDEIYRGLTYESAPRSALAHSERVFVVNSFSKYYGMTGWRLGWLVAPTDAGAPLERLAQNLFLAPGTPAQYAALAAFTPQVEAELQRRRAILRERRDYLLPALRALGFDIPVVPQGAFYLYADSRRFTDDSRAFAERLLDTVGVAITPGGDFGVYRAAGHVRFSYANTLENLKEAVRRMRTQLS
jgi:aspartate/methionine/tyrosine aminotransferase